jgi:glycosyltransferase involved in cell wall biosynthesis
VRILVVSSYPPRHCGIGVYARDQVARLRAEGHDVTVLSPPDGDGDVKAPFLGGRAFLRASRIGRRFDRIVVHFQPALYYRPRAPMSKIVTSGSLLWLVALRRSVQILVHEADAPVRRRPDYALLRWAFKVAPRLTFHTDAERTAVRREYGLRARGDLLAHRVEPAGPTVSRQEARGRLGLAIPRGPVFVCAGFVQPSKGFDRAVRAFRAAGGGSLFVVGSIRDETPENRAYARTLHELCRATPGAEFVERFVDERDFDLWVTAADWLVIPYRRSWSSGVLARAHALGTPAIVWDQGGLPEQAGPDDVVVGSDEQLAAAMLERVVPARSEGATR